MLRNPSSLRALRALIALGFSGLLVLLLACGGGGSGGGTDGTGSVAVLMTDGPVDPDEFSHIYVTITEITLIGPGGHVQIFEGSDTIDLRAVEDTSTLVTLGRDVPAHEYEKIRLEVSEIELVPADGSASVFPKLPPKLDLNPRGSFRVHPDELLVIQIDIDAEKSIHIVETGAGGINFRPVVFVDILSVPLPGKLVLLDGVVEEVGVDEFLLCATHPVSHPSGDGRVTELAASDFDDVPDDGGDDREDFCVDVQVDGDTSFFDEDGDPIGFGDLMQDDPAWVLGRFLQDGDDDLEFLAEVVQLGDDEIVALDGDVVNPVGGDDRFDLDLDPGQDLEGLLEVLVQQGTKIFRRNGDEILPVNIQTGDAARAVGVLDAVEDDLLKAAWVVIGEAATDRTSGKITQVENGGEDLDLDTAEGLVCVDVPAEARVYEVTLANDGASAEEIDRSQLAVGDAVSVFGDAGGTCFVAETLVVFVE